MIDPRPAGADGENRLAPVVVYGVSREFHIAPEEFDEVAAELGRTLDHFKVPGKEKNEVLAAFAAHKGDVTEGYAEALAR